MANPTGKGGFQERKHHINKKGRPKDFVSFRSLAQDIAHEPAQSQGQDIVINDKKITVTEAILRQWAQSKNAKLQQLFIEVAYGKVPQGVELGGQIETKSNVTFDYSKLSAEQLGALIAIAESATTED